MVTSFIQISLLHLSRRDDKTASAKKVK